MTYIEFYKKTWQFLKQEITNIYTHILKFKNLSNTQSSGMITLLVCNAFPQVLIFSPHIAFPFFRNLSFPTVNQSLIGYM
jgi:hypothetical protein